MSEAIITRNCVTGYDVVRLTVQDFRQCIHQYKKNPDSVYCLRNMLDHMQFMQTDDSFDMMPQDVNDFIDNELSEQGVSLKEILGRAFQILGIDASY